MGSHSQNALLQCPDPFIQNPRPPTWCAPPTSQPPLSVGSQTWMAPAQPRDPNPGSRPPPGARRRRASRPCRWAPTHGWRWHSPKTLTLNQTPTWCAPPTSQPPLSVGSQTWMAPAQPRDPNPGSRPPPGARRRRASRPCRWAPTHGWRWHSPKTLTLNQTPTWCAPPTSQPPLSVGSQTWMAPAQSPDARRPGAARDQSSA